MGQSQQRIRARTHTHTHEHTHARTHAARTHAHIHTHTCRAGPWRRGNNKKKNFLVSKAPARYFLFTKKLNAHKYRAGLGDDEV